MTWPPLSHNPCQLCLCCRHLGACYKRLTFCTRAVLNSSVHVAAPAISGWRNVHCLQHSHIHLKHIAQKLLPWHDFPLPDTAFPSKRFVHQKLRHWKSLSSSQFIFRLGKRFWDSKMVIAFSCQQTITHSLELGNNKLLQLWHYFSNFCSLCLEFILIELKTHHCIYSHYNKVTCW